MTHRDAEPGPALRAEALVILPTYEERQTIADVIAGVRAAVPGVHVLVVDDSSPDGTAEVVRSIAGPQVHLLVRPTKSGLASAYLDGFRWGLERGYDRFVEMDADLSHQPSDLPRLLEGAGTYDLTIGSRYVPGGGVSDWSRTRLALSKGANLYARKALRLPTRDATSGFRVFRRDILEELMRQGVASEGYAFQIELVLRAARSGFEVGEVPITFRERAHGRSKLSRRIVVEALIKVAAWAFTGPPAVQEDSRELSHDPATP